MAIEITKDILRKIESELHGKSRSYRVNESYVKGKNPKIYDDPQKRDPDNRIPIPFAKMAVEDMSGYAARPGDITISYDNVTTALEENKNDEYNDIIRSWRADNEDDIEISELYQKMLTHGCSYEIWWTVDNNDIPGLPVRPEWKRVDGDSVIILYDRSLKPVKEAGLYFRTYDNGDQVCDVYYPLYSQRWIKTSQSEWKRDEDGDTEYPYTVVPIIEYTGNMEKMPLFEAEKKMIDAQDRLVSNSANEIDRFNALIALFPGKVTKEFVEKLKELKVIDDLGMYDNWPQYLEKNLGGVTEFYNNLADRLERLFHKSIKIPDFSDEQFSGNSSGVAISYKLLGLEFKASMIETYFNRGLKERKRLIDDIFANASTLSIPVDEYKTVINSQRNLPVDEKMKAEIAMQLKGIISDETLLKFLPKTIVDDPAGELEKLQEQRDSNPLLSMNDTQDDNE